MKYLLSISLLIFGLYACQQKTTRLDQYELHGIDVSHYQSYINWKTIADQEITFAFVKASEGMSMHDPLFCHNWDELQNHGLKRGAYHFFRPLVPARLQALNFSFWVELETGDLPPVLDVEVMDGVSKEQLVEGVRTWLEIIEVKYNVTPILYTNLKFYNKILAGQFDEYPIWIARYNDREPILACGRDWQFWQYGNRGELDGINGYVDFNVFKGSRQELEKLCKKGQPVLSSR